MPNHATIVAAGHLGKDATTRTAGNGGSTATSFPLAVNDKRTKQTIWFDVTLWNKDKLADYLTKGKAVLVSGELGQREWNGKDGAVNKSLTINANAIEFIGAKDEGDRSEPISKPRGASRQTQAYDPDSDLPF